MTPPRSLVDRDAELALIGLLVREPHRFADPRITRLVFADPVYRRIYDVLFGHRVDLAGDPGSASDVLLAQNVPDARSLVSTAVLDMEQFIPDALITFCAKLARRRSLRSLASGLANVADHPATPQDDRESLETIAAQTTALAQNGPSIPSPWIRLDTVIATDVTWLWANRIPFGALTILDGDPGLGKTALALDLAARVSSGTSLPDEGTLQPYPAAGVVLVSAEDDLHRTLRPRVDAAGGDPSKILAFRLEALPFFPDGITILRHAITAVNAALVIIDPIMALLEASVDAYRDQDTRRVTTPLTALATETNTAILLVRHLTKQSGPKALYRGGGSIAWVAAARAQLLLGDDPDSPDSSSRILAFNKNSFGPKADSLQLALATTPTGILRLDWGPAVPTTADDLVAPTPPPTDSRTITEACTFLESLLKDGPVEATTARTARTRAGISERAWKEARRRLRVLAIKNGHAGWSLRLP